MLNETHAPHLTSWITSANRPGCDFPLQNLPHGVFRRRGSGEAFRGGVAIGDQILDMSQAWSSGVFEGKAREAARMAGAPTLNGLMALGAGSWSALRLALSRALREGAVEDKALRACLVPQSEAEYAVPAQIGDYTDFYTSIDHARNVGRLVRPDDPVSPNFQWMPIAYHGRGSSIGVSGQSYRRPMGQAMPPGAQAPVYGPCARLDYELELGIFVGPGNAQGEQIALADAESHIFGICLLNDWSARDIQFWELVPLGPFLGKNFCTTISPWIVTLEALAPFRHAWNRAANEPQPLAYLESAANREHGAFDISLEAWLDTNKSRAERSGPTRLSHTSFRHQYWTPAQMVTHHTVGGCNLQAGDLLGSGTISGPGAVGEAGAIIELTKAGREPLTLDNGERRGFLEDGDAVTLRGWCEAPGRTRIGFGECRGTVLPALAR